MKREREKLFFFFFDFCFSGGAGSIFFELTSELQIIHVHICETFHC